MIVGFGIDVLNIMRLEKAYARFGMRLWVRLFTPEERAYVEGRRCHHYAAYAKRFAAKEAFVKALGTGFRGGISWQDIEVVSDALGAPSIRVRGAAERTLHHLGGDELRVDLSMSDDYPIAQAAVLISRRCPAP